MKGRIYKVSIRKVSFMIGWFPHADKWYHKIQIIY